MLQRIIDLLFPPYRDPLGRNNVVKELLKQSNEEKDEHSNRKGI